jgi:hypothetical protein
LSDADKLRNALFELGLSQRGAARELDIHERTMRAYCAGRDTVPRVIWLALRALGHETLGNGCLATTTGERAALDAAEPIEPDACG